jgi:hypothetical protein
MPRGAQGQAWWRADPHREGDAPWTTVSPYQSGSLNAAEVLANAQKRRAKQQRVAAHAKSWTQAAKQRAVTLRDKVTRP